ncbi:MAG TPA: hypothetical protein VNX18_04400 [Bryobacteraceae bacterium]|nr:hypothetical protein [Bryobacteraceae bacterium]
MYRFALAVFLAASATAASWVEYRMGPFHVISDAGDKAARERLNEMEQLRHVLGVMLGKDSLGVGGPSASQLETVWPIDVVLFGNTKEYGPHALQKPFIEGGSALLSAWTADTPMPRDWLRQLTRMLIDQNSGRMPDAIETALCDLFSTIKVTGTKIMIGAPLPSGELPAERLHAWAKIQLLVTNPDFTGKLRVYLNNMQGVGDEVLATRNAFGLTVAKLDEQVDAYVGAGKFEAAPASGEPLNPNKDFIEKPVDKAAIDALFSELAAGGKDFPPESPRGLVAKRTRPALELAAKANPKWGEPHVRIAALEPESAPKIVELRIATKLEPRNPEYWQALAEAQTGANQYSDADKSWAAAMKAAPTDAERERIKKVRFDLDDKRAAFEVAEKKRIADEKAADLQRAKDSAAAEVHAAEAAMNQKLGGLKPGEKPQAWWEEPPGEKISGSLARVDCLPSGPLRLTIKIDGGGTIRLLVRDPNHLTVKSAAEAKFGCGIQKQARKIRVIYTLKADAKMDTVGDVAMVDFP